MPEKSFLPTLPLDEWEKAKMTLHLILQIIGKVRLKMTPRKNHWWYITEYISPNGFTTGSVPFDEGRNAFEITFNVLKDQVEITSSKNGEKIIPIHDGLTVATFYQQFFTALEELDIEVKIVDKPFDVGIDRPFGQITDYHHYDRAYVERFWRIMLWVDSVFKEFSGRFYGKTCPVHLYWHHLDLAVTRFSGEKGPALDPNARLSDKDAYTHEVISFGFWAGDENIREPAFYSYTYPAPAGLDQQPLQPEQAEWIDSNGSPMALYKYNDLRQADNPRQVLLDFMESAYQAGAKLAGWDMEELRTPALSEM